MASALYKKKSSEHMGSTPEFFDTKSITLAEIRRYGANFRRAALWYLFKYHNPDGLVGWLVWFKSKKVQEFR